MRIAWNQSPTGRTSVTTYQYDKNGNLRFQIDGNNRSTELRYDELDRLTLRIFPGGDDEETEYDANGNVTLIRDANGRSTSHDYDVLNRLKLTTLPADPSSGDGLANIEYLYDANNNLLETREIFESGTIETTLNAYDDFDRLESKTDRWGNKIAYAYDANGNRTWLWDPQDRATVYAFDDLNRLESVTTRQTTTVYKYFRDSRLKEIRYPNAIVAAYTYDDAGRTETITNSAHGNPVSGFSYLYDKNGNRVEQIEEHAGAPAETTTYAYDGADRLYEVAYPDKTVTYTYDDVGNRVTEQERDPADELVADKEYVYNERDEIDEVVDHLDPSRTVAYAYDANGNQISKESSAQRTDYVFDVRDQIVRVERDAEVLGRYTYDAERLRIEKIPSSGVRTEYVYDDQSVLTRETGGVVTKYDYGPDRLLAVNDPSLFGERAYYLFDALRSIANVIDSQGSIQAKYKWDAWGNVREEEDHTDVNPFGFTGHEHDDETGLIYARARFYDPEIGRFLSHDPVDGDPLNPPSLHRYLYAYANPTVYVDPSGQIGILNDLADTFSENGVGKALDLVRDVKQKHGGLAALPLVPIGGILGVTSEAIAFGLEALNVAANAVVAGLAPDSAIGQQAGAELESFRRATVDTFKYVKENPGEVAGAVAGGVKETAAGFFKGDVEALTKTTALIAGGFGVRGAVKLAQAAKAAKTAKAAKVVQGAKSASRGKAKAPADRMVDKGRAERPRECFVAGTLVLTAEGLRPIEELRIDDRVWSRDEETGELVLRRVTQLFVTPGKEILEVEVISSGAVEVIGTTAEHPFWVTGVGWVVAGKLSVGDELSPVDGGEEIRVGAVRRARAPRDGLQF